MYHRDMRSSEESYFVFKYFVGHVKVKLKYEKPRVSV